MKKKEQPRTLHAISTKESRKAGKRNSSKKKKSKTKKRGK